MAPSLQPHIDGVSVRGAAHDHPGASHEGVEAIRGGGSAVLPAPVGPVDPALRGVRHTVRIMSDLQAWAIATAGGSEGEKGRVWASEREFDTVVEELRRVRLEADVFRRRVAIAEGRLELILAAIGRMVTNLPPNGASVGAEA